MNATITPENKTISAEELGKIIRKELKSEFPGVKFSVKTTGEIRVRYTDGPTDTAVGALLNKYEGKGFDSHTDMTVYLDKTVTVDGVEYSVPSVYVTASRELSEGFRAVIEEEITANLNGREETQDNLYNAMEGYIGRSPSRMAEAVYLLARTRSC